ncbi:MAG: polyprenyl synthetase family protein [Pseudomonadota bacterium]
MAAQAQRVDQHLAARCDRLDPLMQKPMAYALQGGKKLRAFLVHQSAQLYDLDGVLPAMSAIEALHAYSLVHDDLPAMDDDDLRRGRPTLHKAFDDATAILTGDALQALSFELLCDLEQDFPRTYVLSLIQRFARSAGAAGMVLGQAQDIAAEIADTPLGLDDIAKLQANKTGALFWWSATVGPVLAGKDDTALADYARAIGLAFQVQDDILDVEGDSATAGKAVGKDADAGKATFVSLLGLDGAKDAAQTCVATAKEALMPFGDRAATLRQLADFIISRQK